MTMISIGFRCPASSIRILRPMANRLVLRHNSTSKPVKESHFKEESLIKKKNDFSDKLNAVIDGRQPYGQLSTDFQDDKLRRIIETSNFGTSSESNQDENASQREVTRQRQEDEIKHGDSGTSTLSDSRIDSKIQADKPDVVFPAQEANIHKEFPNLPSDVERNRNEITKKFNKFFDSLQGTIFRATRALNDVTGYSSIEKLKNAIDNLEADLRSERDKVKKCKEEYTEAISRRSKSQKEVNELLTRKHNWSSEDLERFTNLYRNDHANEQSEVVAQSNLEDAEKRVDSIQLKLTQSILTRYHEEQIWSDKIRRASTWGTWILMGLNMMLFIVATFLVEPWKRRRLVGAFEDKVKLALFETSEQQNWKLDEMIKSKKDTNVSIEEAGLNSSKSKSNNGGLKSWLFNQNEADTTDPLSGAVMKISLAQPASPEQSYWTSFKNALNTYTSVETKSIHIDKSDFNVLLGSTVSIGLAIGSILTYLVASSR